MANLMLLLAQSDPGRGSDPSDAGGLVIIAVIAIVVIAIGILLARKVFVRGNMAETPSEDKPTADSVGAQDEPGVTHDPRAVGRPSDRGYEQKL